ncbi:ferredoxin [Nonomuraea sp. NPDC005983]|uniref:ferredoxin n=1 Tax=Nonomuraea sp. NPDC005983 TaxID=3155595 RepID=UPI0033B42FE3
MKIIIDQDKCVGGGQCVMAAPEVFDQRDSDGVVELLDATPPADQQEAVRDAVLFCPAAAIRLEER